MKLKTFRILLVDDDEDDYILFHVYLKQISERRVCLEWVDTFEKAMRSVGNQKPDLLVVDYRLNGARSGLDLVLAVREKHPNLPAIMVTAHDKSAILDKKGIALLNGYIYKQDLSSKVLLEAIYPLLG